MLRLKKKSDNGKEFSFTLKYNGKFKILKTGETVDVRDFDVANKDVLATEKYLMSKYPGHFQQEKTVGDSTSEKALLDDLENQTERAKKFEEENAILREQVNESTQKLEAVSGEVQTEKERADSLKVEADNATAKVKDLEDEIEKLRLQVAEGGGEKIKELEETVDKLKKENAKLKEKAK